MSYLLFWALLMGAVVLFTALLALLVVRVQRDWRVLRGEGVTVIGRVTGFDQDPDGGKIPVFSYTTASGEHHTVRGGRNALRPPRLGETRRLVYLPGEEDAAEEAGLLGPAAIDAALLGFTLVSGWVLWRLLSG